MMKVPTRKAGAVPGVSRDGKSLPKHLWWLLHGLSWVRLLQGWERFHQPCGWAPGTSVECGCWGRTRSTALGQSAPPTPKWRVGAAWQQCLPSSPKWGNSDKNVREWASTTHKNWEYGLYCQPRWMKEICTEGGNFCCYNTSHKGKAELEGIFAPLLLSVFLFKT